MDAIALISTSVDDLNSTIKCWEQGGAGPVSESTVDEFRRAVALIDADEHPDHYKTKRKLLCAAIRRFERMSERANKISRGVSSPTGSKDASVRRKLAQVGIDGKAPAANSNRCRCKGGRGWCPRCYNT